MRYFLRNVEASVHPIKYANTQPRLRYPAIVCKSGARVELRSHQIKNFIDAKNAAHMATKKRNIIRVEYFLMKSSLIIILSSSCLYPRGKLTWGSIIYQIPACAEMTLVTNTIKQFISHTTHNFIVLSIILYFQQKLKC